VEGQDKKISGAFRRTCVPTIRSGATSHDRRLKTLGYYSAIYNLSVRNIN